MVDFLTPLSDMRVRQAALPSGTDDPKGTAARPALSPQMTLILFMKSLRHVVSPAYFPSVSFHSCLARFALPCLGVVGSPTFLMRWSIMADYSLPPSFPPERT